MRQLLLNLLPEAPPSLDNFVPGSNEETLAALLEWLSNAPPATETCFLLWGEASSGKSHLLHASALPCLDARIFPDLASDLTLDTPPDALAVDHVEALSETGQIALFNLFNRLRAQNGRLLVASSQPPAHLSLREDVRTRLGSGLVYRLVPLSDAQKGAAIFHQAEERAMPLAPEMIDYLLRHAPRDMRTLSALVAALDDYALEHKRPLTLPLLRALLRHELALAQEP